MMNEEEVKKILDKACEEHYSDMMPTADIAQQICQLFEPKPDNKIVATNYLDPITGKKYIATQTISGLKMVPIEEPKPDEGRLLTDEEIRALQRGMPLRSTDFNTMKRCLKAQRDLTASIKDEEIRKEFQRGYGLGALDSLAECQQKIKERCDNCESWLWKSGEAQEIVDKCEAECSKKIEEIIEEIEKHTGSDRWGNKDIIIGINNASKQEWCNWWQALKDKYKKEGK